MSFNVGKLKNKSVQLVAKIVEIKIRTIDTRYKKRYIRVEERW